MDNVRDGQGRPSQPASEAQAEPSILIVEDNEASARGLSLLFTQEHYRPVTFGRGLAALDFLREGRGKKLLAAIIDIHLPDISGLVLSQQLRDLLGPNVPIIVLSGDGSMAVLNSLAHVGATYFFRKPVNTDQLLQRIRELTEPAGA